MTTARMTLYKPVYLEQRVALSPTELRDAAKDIDTYLLTKIRKQLEGQCCMHGYVRPGGTQILSRSMGQAEHGRFTGDFIYYCKVKMMCLLPYNGQIVEARILKMNKAGAYAVIVDRGRAQEAMRILLPREFHMGVAEFDDLQADQGIRVRLLRSRFQINDSYIQSIGQYDGLAPTADLQAEAAAKAAAAEEAEGASVEAVVESPIPRAPVASPESPGAPPATKQPRPKGSRRPPPAAATAPPLPPSAPAAEVSVA